MKQFNNQCELVRRALNTKEEMRQRKITQRELSSSVGMSSLQGQFISNVMRGKCAIPVKRIMEFSKVLGIHPHQIKYAMLKDHEQYINDVIIKNGGSL